MSGSRSVLILLSSVGGGGAERVAAHLANGWTAAGHRVTLLPTFSRSEAPAYPLDDDVRIRFLEPSGGAAGGRRSAWIQWQRLLSLRRAIRQCAPDIVVSFLTNVNAAAVLASIGLGVPVIVSERIYPPLFPTSRWLNWLRRLTYPRAACVVVQTRTTADWFVRHCPAAATAVIANPLVLPLRASEPILMPDDVVPTHHRLILGVGRLDPQKGFADLIDAFSRLGEASRDCSLVILGEGLERPQLETKVAELGLSGRVWLPGWAGNVTEWYGRAALFVLSSRYEGFPNVLLEAMAHGVACVSYDCPTGPADIIRDGENGCLVATADGAAGLASAMAMLLRDEQSRQRLSSGAVDVRHTFALDRILQAWEALMDEVGVRMTDGP